MKKLLIGSTALFAVGAISSAAQADIAKLSVSGQIDIAYSVIDSEVANSDGTDGAGMGSGNSSTQLVFDWGGATESGLQYGARLDYRFQNDDADELYVFLAGDWGRLHIGGDDGVVDAFAPGGESVLAGAWGYDGNHNVAPTSGSGTTGYFVSSNGTILTANPQSAASGSSILTVAPTLATETDDSMKFSYYSPSFSGFQVGASYIPDVSSTSNTTGSGVLGGKTGYEVAAKWDGSFDAVSIGLGGGYIGQTDTTGQKSSQGMRLGTTIGFAGFSFGMGYGDNFDTGCASGSTNCDGGDYWSYGLAYSFGPGAVSIGYIDAEKDGGADGEAYSFDADYRLADGLQAFGGVNYYEVDPVLGAADRDLTQGIVGLRVSF
ncbi:porin [Rhodospirillaceae bacterium KN72]|uniref:Porin n=1 Tax=Pacificispira spongiicola TaxID=2729598 RepID=A0A7Y0E0J5_9PROT|nr:porin [Pacificispira spongiicola]NMM45017.1 porin [Pacificispira spongiicola]